jgi:hypothetical protein
VFITVMMQILQTPGFTSLIKVVFFIIEEYFLSILFTFLSSLYSKTFPRSDISLSHSSQLIVLSYFHLQELLHD